jgi:hypothetical protein
MPWFDLFMMRKQFLNLRRLAEKTAAGDGKPPRAGRDPGA